MNEKYSNFCSALDRLEEALTAKPEGLNLDGILQRFEFTYELAWNVCKVFLFKEGIDCRSPRECFRAAYQAKYFTDEQAWLDMIKDRNLSSHIYDEKQALGVYQNIQTKYVQQFKLLKEYLGAKI